MTFRMRRSGRLAAALALAGLALSGCGRLNRTATINQVTTTSGSVVAAALAQQLADRGLSVARVTCARVVIVDVDSHVACTATRAGKNTIVRFSFSSLNGQIKASSVVTQ